MTLAVVLVLTVTLGLTWTLVLTTTRDLTLTLVVTVTLTPMLALDMSDKSTLFRPDSNRHLLEDMGDWCTMIPPQVIIARILAPTSPQELSYLPKTHTDKLVILHPYWEAYTLFNDNICTTFVCGLRQE